MFNNCKIVNIVWIERGVILTIIYYILKYYDKLLHKTIIIDNDVHCKFFKILFPKLTFNIYKEHHKLNFYFNFRKIIKNQDIIIDYLSNYNTINTSKLSMVPWYDMNDPIIVYKYSSNKELHINKYKQFIKNFSNCKRGNYNGVIWDAIIENNIIKKYLIFSKNNYNQFMIFFNNFIKSNYTNTVIEKLIPRFYYINNNIVDKEPKNKITVLTEQKIINNENDLIDLLKVINEQIETYNKLYNL